MSFLELNESREPDGRRRFKASLHEIYPDSTQWNNNGICYLREYTERNMESAKSMPICCEFLDGRKREPYGHGATGMRPKDGMPMFEDSEVVGVTDDAWIEDVVVEGHTCTVLMCSGYIYEQRYPNLVEWIEQCMAANMLVRGSVEFVGRAENGGDIRYLGDFTGEGRIPTDYIYSGYCLLGVPAGDNSAVVFELNQNRKQEEIQMDEQTRKEINDIVVNAVDSLRTVENELRSENESLKAQLNEKDNTISQLNEQIGELNSQLVAKGEEASNSEAKLTEAQQLTAQVQGELDRIKADNARAQLNSALAGFDEAQRAVAADEIAAFDADPLAHVSEINQIINKIEAAAYRALKSEQNSAALFAGMAFESHPKTQPEEDDTTLDPFKDFN